LLSPPLLVFLLLRPPPSSPLSLHDALPIWFTDYLPHDGSRPHLALGVDPLKELKIADAGDIELPSGDTELSLRRLEEAVQQAARSEEHTVELQSLTNIVFRPLLYKKTKNAS